ncbi:MAG: cytochrome C, partial [candidate division Zixibacteria bacterium]|nr:heme-binding domain-containing protein [candidate division KSB1 bacterium]NIR64993.1 heme-binding domain-containing protein [candidate division Zixibacteria bacterium]NIW45786.1 cytochrome C [Gammaproteobacteria bacterium]NIS46786.1 heme-binding domain-containing protein [candidate division Zixibacteria bacterium]NIT72108.1 heme-binding domain-containing protein [candidate division KSB1 bacterium]
MSATFKKVVSRVLIALIAVLILIQFVPYGHSHENPPVLQEPQWHSKQTRQQFKQSCFDCHSNETVWPWYSYIAPASWLVQKDVEEGREELNFSEWGSGRDGEESEEIVEMIREEKMPLENYLLLHPEAKLTNAEREQMIQGIEATLGMASGNWEGEEHE